MIILEKIYKKWLGTDKKKIKNIYMYIYVCVCVF